MADEQIPRGIIDTSVVIDLEHVPAGDLPAELAVSAVPWPNSRQAPTRHPIRTSARRQDRLQRAEATFEPLPVDANVARAYGRIYAAVSGTGRKARGARPLDLVIAATALASDLPLYTRNPGDFRGTESLIGIVTLAPAT